MFAIILILGDGVVLVGLGWDGGGRWDSREMYNVIIVPMWLCSCELFNNNIFYL